MVSGIAMASNRTVGAHRRQLRILSMRRPVANSATITVISATTSHTSGEVRGSGIAGRPGTTAQAPIPSRISRPDAAGSRLLANRGSQNARITAAPIADNTT